MCPFHSFAQNVMLLNSKQGLSNSCINSIYEDSRHNIWFTTLNGLNRFDGLKINAYYHNDDDNTSLLNDETNCVYEYDHDHIIVGTGIGLQIYNHATDRFQTLPFIGINGDTVKVRFSSISSIETNGKKRFMICFSGYGNAELYQDKNGNFRLKHITEFNHGSYDNPHLFLQDNSKRIWIIGKNGELYEHLKNGMKLHPEVTNAVKMCIGVSGKMYVATSNQGLYLYNGKNDKFEMVATAEELGGVVYGLKAWDENRMFVCTDGGGIRTYHEKTRTVTETALKINNFNLSRSNIKDAICDSCNNVWAGIYWMGVVIKHHNQSAFEYIGRNSITKNTIGTNSVFSIAPADSKHIWVATDNDGLYLVSNDGTASTHYSTANQPGMPKAFTYIYSPKTNGKHSINSRTLLGTYMDGLWKMENGNISHLTKEINQIFEIKPADNGNVWIATMGNGIFYYNPTTQNYIQYTSDWSKGEEGTKIIGNPFVYCILQDNSNIFVGTADGLHICHHDGNGIITKKSDRYFRNITIKHLALSKDKKFVWVATNNGLYRINLSNKEIKRYTSSDGLANNSVKAVFINNSNVWAATDNGLSCLNTKNNEFTNFVIEDGIQDNEFNRGAIIPHDGNLYIGGISGLTYFDPNTITTNKTKQQELKIKFIDVRIRGEYIHADSQTSDYEVMKGILDDCAEITLSHKDNYFILELCVNGLSNQHITFEYSMNGKNWINQADGSRLIFNNLSAGTHNIHIRARSYNAVSDERILVVHVKPIWYASWWAKLIYLMLFILLYYLIHMYAKRQIEARKLIERNRQQAEINEARIQFFMNLSHEIRTPMTLILAPIDKLLRKDKDEECKRDYNLIKQNANRILRLINQMMDVRKIEQGKFELEYKKCDIVPLLQNIYDVFCNQAENRNIRYTFEHEGISSLAANVDPENVDKMIMNLLSNAFKFTPDGGEIKLRLEKALSENGKETFKMSVLDSGVGIPEENKGKVFDRFYSAGHANGYIGTGIGLNLTAMLVDLHKGSINVIDNPSGTGTEFDIVLPVNMQGKDNKLTSIFTGNNNEEQEIIPSDASVQIDHTLEAEPLIQEVEIDKNNSTLVLVEDDSAIRQYVQSEMSAEFNVVDYSDGQQAWDYVIAHPNEIGLIISDIMMPVMDGLTLCQKVKSNFNTNHIPVLLMTALGSDEDRIVGITNGADAYVSKPFNIDVLRTTAFGLLRNRQLLQGRFKAEQLHEETIEKVELESPDENLMRRIMKVINDNIDNDELSVEMIADMVGISRVHFYRKMKDMTGQSPREFLKYVRLKEAARLLSTKKMDISSVSVACGFKSPSSFSTYFKALYGISPTEWVKKQTGEE